MKVNGSLDMAKFKIRINRRQLDLGDDPEIIPLGNAADLTFNGLVVNLPIMAQYNQWRIDKIVTHWKVLNKSPHAWRGDLVNHALVYSVPNDSSGVDGSLENLMFNTNVDLLNNYLQNYQELRGVHFKKCKWQYGKRIISPYVSERIQTLAKNSTAAPTVIDDIRRNYKKTFRYSSSAIRYEAPVYMVVPGLTKTTYDITGANGGAEVSLTKAIDEFPKLEIYSDVYVTCKQYKNFSTANPPTFAGSRNIGSKMEPMANEINLDFNKVKQDVQDQVHQEITNSHPIIGAVAAMAGFARKRPRDEFKM